MKMLADGLSNLDRMIFAVMMHISLSCFLCSAKTRLKNLSQI
jgi:hypothetical protein